MHYKALLFDLDGTLIDSLGDLCDALNRTLVSIGRTPLPEAQLRGFIGDGMETLLQRTLDAGAGSQVDLPDVIRVFRADYGEHFLDRTAFFPGIESFLDRLDIPLAVVSNKPERFCRDILVALGAEGRFAAIFGGDSFEKKPSPVALHQALKIMEVGPGAALMVGDGVQDVAVAKAAGVESCAVNWGLCPEAELRAAHPDHFVRSVGELSALVLGG